MEELRTQFPDEAPDSQNTFKLIQIIYRHGVGAFNGFLEALNEHATSEPDERAHKELFDILNKEANIVPLSKQQRPSDQPPMEIHTTDTTHEQPNTDAQIAPQVSKYKL